MRKHFYSREARRENETVRMVELGKLFEEGAIYKPLSGKLRYLR